MDYSKICPLQKYVLLYIEEADRPKAQKTQFGLIVPERETPIKTASVIRIGSEVTIFGEAPSQEDLNNIAVFFNNTQATDLGNFYYLVPEEAIVAKTDK